MALIGMDWNGLELIRLVGEAQVSELDWNGLDLIRLVGEAQVSGLEWPLSGL